MREPILPPPPPTRVAVRAALNAIWFRAAAAVRARIAAAVRAARRHRARLAESAPTCSRTLPQVPLALLAREERATVVQGRRAG